MSIDAESSLEISKLILAQDNRLSFVILLTISKRFNKEEPSDW